MKFEKMSFFGGGLAKAGMSAQIIAAQHIEIAKELIQERFGDGALSHARPTYIKNRSLAIEVMHPAIAEELRLQEEGFVQELNKRIGSTVVVRLYCILPTQRDVE